MTTLVNADNIGEITKSPKYYGAAGNGITNDTVAFQAAINALPATGGVIDLGFGNYIVTIASLVVGSKNVRWTGKATVNGVHYWLLPGGQNSFSPALGRELYNDPGLNAVFTAHDNQRIAAYAGGLNNELTFLERWFVSIAATVGSAGQRRAEKAGHFRVDSASPHANGIALFTQARASAAGAVWAHESVTYSNVIPTTYAHRCEELAIVAVGEDTNNLRWIQDVVSHSSTGAYDALSSVYAGVYVNAGTVDLKNGIVIKDHDITACKIRNAAVLLDTDADQMQAIARTAVGKIKFGSQLNTGAVAQLIGQGKNTASALVAYSVLETSIGTNTAGAEIGVLKLSVIAAGVSTTALQLNGGVGNSLSVRVNSILKQVSEGAVDSGGVGFKLLRVAN